MTPLLKRAPNVSKRLSLKLKLWGLPLLIACWALAFEANARNYYIFAERYTATGTNDPYSGKKCHLYEYGSVSSKNGFIPSPSTPFRSNNYITCSHTIDPELNGQVIVGLFAWGGNKSVAVKAGLKRSSKTYGIDGGFPYVIVLDSSGGTFTKKPIISLSVPGEYSLVTEGVAIDYLFSFPGEFLFTLDEASVQDTKIFFTVFGTAKNGTDYTKITKDITIPAGKTFSYVAISPINDQKKEKTETVSLKLKASAKYYKIGTPQAVSVKIIDND
ncbi:MAG: hypothetical protein ABL925_08190 [Methylococcales bacterium]